MYIFTILVGISLTSCTSINVISNKSESFNKRIQKIYIICEGTRNQTTFYSVFRNLMHQALSLRGVDSEIKVKHYLSLETDSAIYAKVNAYRPEVVVVVNQSEAAKMKIVNTGPQGSGGYAHGYGSAKAMDVFDLIMTEYPKKDPVWRASLEVGSSEDNSFSAEGAVKALIKKNGRRWVDQ